VTTEGSEACYHDVTLFVQRIRRAARSKRVVPVLPDSLRGSALTWWVSLPEARQDDLEAAPLADWIGYLQRSFSLPREQAMRNLRTPKARFSREDAASGRSLVGYLDYVCRLGRALDFSEQQILDHVFAGLYDEIKLNFLDIRGQVTPDSLRDIFSERQTTVQQFFRYKRPPSSIPGSAPGSTPGKSTSQSPQIYHIDEADDNDDNDNDNDDENLIEIIFGQYTCRYCSRQFKTEQGLRMHAKSVHKRTYSNIKMLTA
jgi:C2H2-type zinc finger